MKINDDLKRAFAEEQNEDSIKWHFVKTTKDGRKGEACEIKRLPDGNGGYIFKEVVAVIDRENGKRKQITRNERVLADDEMTNEQFEKYKQFSADDYRESGNASRRGVNRHIISYETLCETGHEGALEDNDCCVSAGTNADRNKYLAKHILRLARLTDTQRRRWEQHEVEGMTFRQIASLENCAVNAVKEAYDAAVKKIKDAVNSTLSPEYRDEIVKRDELLRAREACNGCMYYQMGENGELCTKNQRFCVNHETGETWTVGDVPITEGVENNPDAVVRLDDDGKARIYNLTCFHLQPDELVSLL